MLHRPADPSGRNFTSAYNADTGVILALAAGEVLHIFAQRAPGFPGGDYSLVLSGTSGNDLLRPGQSVGCIRPIDSLPPLGLGANPPLDLRVAPGSAWERLLQMVSRAGGGAFQVTSSASLLPAIQAAREAARRAQCVDNVKKLKSQD